jgi:hypothetical protein
MENVLVPQHISKYGLFTGQFILGASLYCFYDNYNPLCYCLAALYLTTMLHWKNLKNRGLIRYLDITATSTVLVKTTFYDSIRWKQYRKIWFYVLFFSCLAYSINKYVISSKKKPTERDYYISVFVHVFFLHIIIPSTACGCAILVNMSYAQ